MNSRPDKDLYSIMGAGPDSSAEEIRAAYVARARVLHPDRFDQQNQTRDWQSANEMMAELNEAYAVLRNPDSRAEYDQVRAYRHQLQETPPSADQESQSSMRAPSEFGELASGWARFADLPAATQSRLVNRQNNVGIEQVQVRLDSIGRNLLLLAVLASWFCALFIDAAGEQWSVKALLWRCGVTLVLGFVIGLNLVKVCRWMMSTVTSNFYVTPLYFIKTEYDAVLFRPLWTLKDVAITHHRSNRSYRGSSIVFKFDGHDESVTMLSKRGVEVLFERLRQYDTRLRVAFANHDEDYIHKNDDFIQVHGTESPPAEALSGWGRLLIHMSALFLGCLCFCAAAAINRDLPRSQWTTRPGGHVLETMTQERYIPQFISEPVSSALGNISETILVVLLLAFFFTACFVGARLAKRTRSESDTRPCDNGEPDVGDGGNHENVEGRANHDNQS